MDYLDFFARLADSVAWPIAATVALLIVKRPLSELVPLVRRLKFGDLQVDFHERISEAEEQVAAIVADPSEAPPAPQALRDTATVAPRDGIISAWINILNAQVRLARRHGIDPSARQRHGRSFERVLAHREIIDPRLASLITELRIIRNQAAHEADLRLNEEDANRYVSISQQLVRELDGIQPQT